MFEHGAWTGMPMKRNDQQELGLDSKFLEKNPGKNPGKSLFSL